MEDNKFTVEILPQKEWLKTALRNLEDDKLVRICVTIVAPGPKTMYSTYVQGGGEGEYVRIVYAGEVTHNERK